eukprot:363662-Chlamydomonas_euryale.AAC.6
MHASAYKYLHALARLPRARAPEQARSALATQAVLASRTAPCRRVTAHACRPGPALAAAKTFAMTLRLLRNAAALEPCAAGAALVRARLQDVLPDVVEMAAGAATRPPTAAPDGGARWPGDGADAAMDARADIAAAASQLMANWAGVPGGAHALWSKCFPEALYALAGHPLRESRRACCCACLPSPPSARREPLLPRGLTLEACPELAAALLSTRKSPQCHPQSAPDPARLLLPVLLRLPEYSCQCSRAFLCALPPPCP